MSEYCSDSSNCEYLVTLPRAIQKELRSMGTVVSHGGLVAVVRRRPERHSQQVLSDFFASDAFYLNVWKALTTPDDITPQSLQRSRSGEVLRDSFLFFKDHFCRDNQIALDGIPHTQDLESDSLKVVVDFAGKERGRDGHTITYYLTTSAAMKEPVHLP